MSDVRGSVYLK
ncbi:hypothetical protein F383_38697 [Gossypium arboreum]|uniref:Uncharacterized protein n=1 Tax=Gossypium arboreum TaxID=29729 RepID=A0A0B0MGU5_GOSAR|nr:hypothetical protein F383_38697 [Gossypium arboreum]